MLTADHQAAALRRWRAQLRPAAGANQPAADRLLVVASGKGGVGKTNLAVNLAVVLQQAGHHTLVIDADIGFGNVETLCGLHCPHNLADFFAQSAELPDIIEVGPAGIWCIAGGTVLGAIHTFDQARLQRLLTALASLRQRPDTIILDLPAGINDSVRACLAATSEIFLVTTPEPTALADAYAIVKATAPLNPAVRIQVVINQAHSPREGEQAFERLRWTAAHFLNLQVNHVATVPADTAVPRAVRRQQPFVLSSPLAPASRAIRSLGRELDRDFSDSGRRHVFTNFLHRLAGLKLSPAKGGVGRERY